MAATLDTSSAEAMRESLRRQKDMLDALRAENKDLRSSLAQSNRGVTTASPVAGGSMAHQRREAEHIQSKLFSLRRTLDATKAHNDERAKEIGRLQEKLDELRVEARPLLSEQSPIAQKIRALENRLDKALIKHNEALAIRRTYEQIVKRLQEERVGFDNQLAAIEKTLKSKEHDYAELQNMAHDAHHAKEIARAEVAQFKAAYAEERRAKKKELEERKQYVQAQMEKTLKQERAAKAKQQRQAAEDGQAENSNGDDARGRRDAQATSELRTEEEEERLRHLEAAYRRMREATRATNVDGVIAAYEEQQDTKQSLEATVKEAQRSIERLQQQRTELKRKLEDAKFGGGAGLLGSRRIVDEFETHLTEARANRNKALQNFERVAGVMVGVMAGIEHLVEKLSTFQKEPGERPKVTEKDLVKALSYCDSTLENVMGAGQADVDNAARHMDLVEVKLPVHNVRIALSKRGDDEHDGPDAARTRADAEDADDDPHTRESLKAMTKSTVDREDKKARKRGRKKEDEN